MVSTMAVIRAAADNLLSYPDLDPTERDAMLSMIVRQADHATGVLQDLEYGLSQMWWGARLTRIAPVSREMILNYVAEHSLGLPRSY